MGMSAQIIHSKIIKNPSNGWDAFSISLKKLEGLTDEDCHFYLDSDIIPTPILSYFDFLIDAKYVYHEDLDMPEYAYLNELLDIVADQIIMNKRNTCFFYPLDFLDKEFEIDIKKISQFIRAKSDIRNCIHSFIDENRLYHLLYINQLIRIPKPARNRSFYTKKRISRQDFESYLVSFEMEMAYVEIYHRAITFKVLKDRNNFKLFACCFSEYNRVILAINISD